MDTLVRPLKDIVIIYHKHCQDGFGAAFAAYQKFKESATYIPLGNDERSVPPDGLVDKEVYILDFSFSKEILLTLEQTNKKVMVIDHHFSAQEDVKSIREHIFELDHSGAYLSWEFFVGGEIPFFIKLLDMIDLAKDTSHEYTDLITYILSKPFTFEQYQELLEDLQDESKLVNVKKLGKAQNDYIELIIDAIISEPDFVEFEGYTVPCVNFSLPINEKSIALRELYQKYPPFSMSYRYDNGKIKFSLRGNGEVDLTVLAGKYGGGGHKSASGFVIDGDSRLPFTRINRNK